MAGIELAESLFDPRLPAHHSVLARDHAPARALVRGHESGGDIAGADVFAKRGLHLLSEIRGKFAS